MGRLIAVEYIMYWLHHQYASDKVLWQLLGCRQEAKLRVVPHFYSGRVEEAKRERAWESPHARRDNTRGGKSWEKSPHRVLPLLAWGDIHARSRFALSSIPEEKWRTTRSLARGRLGCFRAKLVYWAGGGRRGFRNPWNPPLTTPLNITQQGAPRNLTNLLSWPKIFLLLFYLILITLVNVFIIIIILGK